MPSLKSNAGIVEEIKRLDAHLKPADDLFFPMETCDNYRNKVPLHAPKAYCSFAANAYGSNPV